MKRSNGRKNLIAALIFFALLVVSGAALAATGNWENPLAAFSGRFGGRGEREGFDRGGQFPGGQPPGGGEAQGGQPPGGGERGGQEGGRPFGDREGGRDNGSWSFFGHVLYNVWYLFATSGVVMLIGTGIGFVRKRFRKPAAPPPADALIST